MAPGGRRGTSRIEVDGPLNSRVRERVAYLLDGVALAVREVIARVDVPDGAGARMAGVENTVDDGVEQVHVR